MTTRVLTVIKALNDSRVAITDKTIYGLAAKLGGQVCDDWQRTDLGPFSLEICCALRRLAEGNYLTVKGGHYTLTKKGSNRLSQKRDQRLADSLNELLEVALLRFILTVE